MFEAVAAGHKVHYSLANQFERLTLHTIHKVLSTFPLDLWAHLCVTQCCTTDTLTPPVRQITSWQELNQSMHECTCVLEIAHAHTAYTHQRISSAGSFHIFENSHTCVIMLRSHITLRTPTQASAVHTVYNNHPRILFTAAAGSFLLFC